MTDSLDPTTAGIVEFTRWLSEMQTSVAESVGGVLLRGARAVPVDSIRTKPTFSPCALVGYSLIATEVTVGGVRLRDRDRNIIAVADLSNNPALNGQSGSASAWFGPGGINVPDGGLILDADIDFEGVVYLRGTD
jgi:hypothetical protein